MSAILFRSFGKKESAESIASRAEVHLADGTTPV
jgi:hypothetical protein